jgi:hypothetical protein
MAGTDHEGYSGTPLWAKIGVKPGHVVALVNRPADWVVDDAPDGCAFVAAGLAQVTVAFHRDLAGLRQASAGYAAGHASDITENELRDLFLPLGVVDVKVAALGIDWSGLKFVRRKELRGR